MSMATTGARVTEWPRPLVWLGNFLRDELAPYPGRCALVARMVVAASLVMIVNMTFRIPFGAYAAIYALTTSRENPDATLGDVKTSVTGFAIAAAYVLVGAVIFSGEPVLRIVWVLASLFLMFFALSAAANHLVRLASVIYWLSFLPYGIVKSGQSKKLSARSGQLVPCPSPTSSLRRWNWSLSDCTH